MKKRVIASILAFYTIFLCSGCAGKLQRPILHSDTIVSNTPLHHVKNEQTLYEDEVIYKVLISSNSRYLALNRIGPVKIIDLQNNWQLDFPNISGQITFAPNGQQIATAEKNSIKIFSLQPKALIHEWQCKNKPTHIAYSPNGKWIAVSTTESVQVLDSETGRIVFEKPQKNSVAFFSPDNKKLAVIINRNIASLQETAPIEYISGTIILSAWLLDASIGIFKSDSFFIYDLETQDLLVEQTIPDTVIRALAFSKDGRFFAVGMVNDWETLAGGWIDVYQTSKVQKIYSWQSTQFLDGVMFSPLDNCLTEFFSSKTPGIKIHDLTNGEISNQFILKNKSRIEDVVYSQDGKYLAVAVNGLPYGQSSIIIYDAEDNRIIYSSIKDKIINDLAFSPNGEFLATASTKGVALIPMEELRNCKINTK